MPSETFSVSVATGLGVSVLAGIISGVCFVIGYRRKITRHRDRKWHCNVCGEYFRSVEFVLGRAEFVVCDQCKTKVCKLRCSSINLDGAWICQTCCERTDSWIDDAFKVVEPFTKALRARMSLVEEHPDDIEEDPETQKIRDKEQVRDFIERLVNNLIGENVDDASINKIYDDVNYLPIVGESPCSAHSALRKIVQKIIREANDLPQLRGAGTNNSLEQEGRTYEDLLSTAILNKIISSSQNSINPGTSCSSRANSVCSHRSSSSRRRRLQKEYFFGEETLDNKWKNVDTDTASVSSLEEWVHSDSSLGSTKYVDKVSLTIKQRIEEVSSSESEADEPLENDDVEYFRSNSAFGNDEPNWFLQKKQFRAGTSSPVPVPMLVPDPTTDAKVLIGDQEIEDTSDLSDVPSDFEEHNDGIGLMSVKNHLIESKAAIGGKNPLADLDMGNFSDDEVSADSGVKDDVDSEKYSTSKHEFVVDASISSDGSNIEKDTEYTERYATLPRTIMVSPKNNRLQENRYNANNEHQDSMEKNGFPEESDEENQPNEFTGVYSQREKEKWKHAVELKNNPYSKENIERRIKSRNSINSLFGNDYYIRQASLPSGAKRSEVKNLETFSKEESYQTQEDNQSAQEDEINHIPQNTQITSTPNKDTKNSENTYNSISDSEIHFSSEITSDSDVSLINCYDVSESVVYKKISADDEEIQTAEKIFDFESLEVSLPCLEVSPTSEERKEEQVKPVAKPRKRAISYEMIEKNKMEQESDAVKLVKYKETNEDSFDTIPYIINKRSDNTLIKKIYSDPSVRSFALNNRSKLPISEMISKPVMNMKPADEKKVEVKIKNSLLKNKETLEKLENEPNEMKLFTNALISENMFKMDQLVDDKIELNGDNNDELECFYAQAFAHGSNPSRNLNSDYEALEEISKLKEQKLVANRLKQFSKSSINLSTICDESVDEEVEESEKLLENLDNSEQRKLSGLQNGQRSTSVRDLMKKFEQFDANAKAEKPIMYSLTGRSISKQFKEKLRDLNEDTPSLSQIHSMSLTNLELEENIK